MHKKSIRNVLLALLGVFVFVIAASCQAPVQQSVGFETQQSISRTLISGTTRIEAETYSDMSGVQVESCTDGGQNIGYIDTGDWMVYPITINSAGRYKIEFNIASENGGNISVDINAGSTVLGQVEVPPTGGWQSWQTVSLISDLPSGSYNIGLFAQTGGWNLNWIQISPISSSGITTGKVYKLINQTSGKALDVSEASTENGANVQQWGYGDGKNQQWRIDDAGSGLYKLTAVHSGKVLDVDAISAANGANIHQWEWVGGANQKWQIIDTGNGFYKLLASHSGKALDIDNSQIDDGINIQQWEDNNSGAQKWQILEVTDNNTTTGPAQGKTMVWHDEFEYNGAPNSNLWGYDIGGGGWGNNEWQTYTNSITNASVANGVLSIKALKDGNGNWTSGRIKTANKGDWTYCYVETRAKLPAGLGTWPAIWMLPTDWVYGGWPDSGEIDIMEHVGYDQDVIHTTIHTASYNHTLGTQIAKYGNISGVSTSYHTYGMLWEPNTISYYIDGNLFFTINKGASDTYREWPFDQRFHLILNVAIGGDWGGAMGVDSNMTSAIMDIDYVRVYQ